MKTYAALLALGLVALADTSVLAQRGRRGGPSAGAHGWLSGLEQGQAQARQTGTPLMVVLRCQP